MRSSLPARFAGHVPPPLTELAVGASVALVFLALRIAIIPIVGDRAPYAFVFLGIVVSCVIAGWRSGLITLLTGQVLVWALVVDGEPIFPWAPDSKLGGLLVSTLSQAIILAIIAVYQREIGRGVRERERRVELLDQARREIDHRARNNYQTVLSLVQLQANREPGDEAKLALGKVTDRISAISLATEHLAVQSDDIGTVRLRDHLCGLCGQLERGLAGSDVRVECDVPDVTASADTATNLAIIVNELVTNALKHAFGDGGQGLVAVRGKVAGPGLEILIIDDGKGMKAKSANSGTGLGMKLVETFARHLDAKHEVESPGTGTIHRLIIPTLA